MNFTKDPPLVTSTGDSLEPVPHGVTFRKAVTHVDNRGSVCELLDERWDWCVDPIKFTYMFTLKPNRAKGWGMHMHHVDRYFVIFGEMEVIMYDTREDSPTKGLLAKVNLNEWERRIMSIPIGVWHANYNPGSKDAIIINHPTEPYDHDNPDKYRLPLDNDEIPYKFHNSVIGW